MSVSSGSIVGADGVPTAKLILRVASGSGTYDATFCLNREVNASNAPVTYNYDTLIPKKVGCDIDVADLIEKAADPTQTFAVMGLHPTNGWVPIAPADAEVTLDLIYVEGGLGCFNQGKLTLMINSGIYCDLIVCANGNVVLPPCKSIQGCENFCMYITKKADGQ